jgi:hypothetical protein
VGRLSISSRTVAIQRTAQIRTITRPAATNQKENGSPTSAIVMPTAVASGRTVGPGR